jgi:small-conductance mechanosensitive channel
MTHSIFIHLIAMFIAAFFAAAILWGEHYHPWSKPLDPRLNYVLGTLAMLIPYSVLLLFWLAVTPPMLALFALLSLWLIVAVSGLTVHWLYEYDAKRSAQERMLVAEAAERAARNESA